MGEILCGAAVGGRYGVTSANLETVAEAGLDLVEIPFNGQYFRYHEPAEIDEAARALRESGVSCRSIHLGFEDDYDVSSTDAGIREDTVEDMKYALSAAPALGASIAVIHGSSEPIGQDERPRRIALLEESLGELCAAAAANGVRLALELLPRTCLGNTVDEALGILGGFEPAQIGFCVDVNHVNLREDPAECVRRLAGRIVSFHISDNDGVDERHWFPFDGVIDWKRFMDAVRQTGYSGQFIFETGGSLKGDPSAYLAEVRARFDRLMAL